LCRFSKKDKDHEEKLRKIAYGQDFLENAAAIFVWSVIPKRIEWCIDVWSHKTVAQDSGHMCQNLYLGCQAIHAGTCAMTVYHQNTIDDFLGLDGEEEFTIYLATVGKLN
jgi:nitroreductase